VNFQILQLTEQIAILAIISFSWKSSS